MFLSQPSPQFLPQLPELIVRQEEAEHFGQTSPALSSLFLSMTLSVTTCFLVLLLTVPPTTVRLFFE